MLHWYGALNDFTEILLAIDSIGPGYANHPRCCKNIGSSRPYLPSVIFLSIYDSDTYATKTMQAR
jgi:hypothetical protein